MINQEEMRKILIDNRQFFRKLAKDEKYINITLKNASIDEVNSIIYFIWYISKGKIPIKKFAFDQLNKKGLIKYLKKVFVKKDCDLIEKSRAEKLKVINRLKNHFKDIFHYIFHHV